MKFSTLLDYLVIVLIIVLPIEIELIQKSDSEIRFKNQIQKSETPNKMAYLLEIDFAKSGNAGNVDLAFSCASPGHELVGLSFGQFGLNICPVLLIKSGQ